MTAYSAGLRISELVKLRLKHIDRARMVIRVEQGKGKIEVADVLREYIMPPEHYQVVYDILNCRNAYLGGHIEECDNCGTQRNAYNSCRNRHCPKCQTIAKERWLEARKAELLPVPYFHSVFTLPHELNPVILCNKKVMPRLFIQGSVRDAS